MGERHGQGTGIEHPARHRRALPGKPDSRRRDRAHGQDDDRGSGAAFAREKGGHRERSAPDRDGRTAARARHETLPFPLHRERGHQPEQREHRTADPGGRDRRRCHDHGPKRGAA